MRECMSLLGKGVNDCHFELRDDVPVVVKRYLNKERFECEILYHSWFKEKSFLVPSVLDISTPEKMVTFEYIEGKHPDVFNGHIISLCIEKIAHIQTFGKIFSPNEQATFESYVVSLRKSFNTDSLSALFDFYLPSLKTAFRTGIFKDAKPHNWIITADGRLFLIDFDDVRPSFFLSDLAQFLGYLLLEDETIDIYAYFQKFLRALGEASEIYYPLFLLALFHSNVKKIQYVKHQETIQRLWKKNQILIRQLQSLKK